jgi:CARDB
MMKRKTPTIRKEESIAGKKDDKIRVTSFSVKPINPKQGETVTIKMHVKNVSSSALNSIPWQIVCDKKVLESGIRSSLPKGDTFTIGVTWTAKPGSHFIYGDIDPDNTLNEPRAKQFNNSPQGVDVVVSK